MKIKAVHDVCGREVLVQQILQTQGHCPWDGLPFQPDYTGVLSADMAIAERAGTALAEALERIAGVRPAFYIDESSVLGEISLYLAALRASSGKAPAGEPAE